MGQLNTKQEDPKPGDFPSWPREKQDAWWADYFDSPAGLAYWQSQQYLRVPLSSNGSFAIDDVPPGRYTFSTKLEIPEFGVRGYVGPKVVGHVSRDIEIPDGPRGEVLDFGSLDVSWTNMRNPKVGDEAPEIVAKTIEGEPFALSKHRGKFVLLDFWATWCAPCLVEAPHVQAAHDALAKDGLVVVGLSLDDGIDAPKKYLAAKPMPGVQVLLGGWTANRAAADYGVQSIPKILLIGPDGKVAATDLRGEQMKEEIERAMKDR